MKTPIFRFAPSPNGELHLGHAYSALINQREAERLGGVVLVRIEDIDQGRSRKKFIDQIFCDLEWLGLSWPEPVRFQSRHFADYARALVRLEAEGLLYPCFCNRGQIKENATSFDPDGTPLYPGSCKAMTASERDERLARGEAFAMRLDMDAAVKQAGSGLEFIEQGKTIMANPQKWGDVVLRRKDTPTSYHLSVVVDDGLQNVSHIVRGSDLYEATHLHRLLQHLLDLPVPQYHHHRLIGDDDGRKLSKRFKDRSLKAIRASGMTAQEVRHELGL